MFVILFVYNKLPADDKDYEIIAIVAKNVVRYLLAVTYSFIERQPSYYK